jgi:hypothetical protein
MADTMDFFIDSCSSSVTERWERYLWKRLLLMIVI